jgi:lysophospholipid hydrolase
MGAFVGGLYAREGDLISAAGRAKHFSSRMANLWRMLTDVTYPIVAYTTVSLTIIMEIMLTKPSLPGARVQSFDLQGEYIIISFLLSVPKHGLQAFYDLHIEDMWLPYFCNTTNIITSRMDIHETGYAWRFIRKSKDSYRPPMLLIAVRPRCIYDIGWTPSPSL